MIRYVLVGMLVLTGIGAAVMLFVALRQSAPEPATLAATYGDWQIGCEETTGRCVMNQRVIDGENKVQLLHLEIEPQSGGPDAIRVLTPLGAWLEPGVALKASEEGEALALSFSKCLPNGCLADGVISDDMQKQLDGAKTASLLVGDKARRIIGIPVSLEGYKEAQAALLAAQKASEAHGPIAALRKFFSRIAAKPSTED